MCHRIDSDAQKPALGAFSKGNEPEPVVMPILVAPCRCNKLWARFPTNRVWVEVEE